jgi:acyl-CoA thioester hydrolase
MTDPERTTMVSDPSSPAEVLDVYSGVVLPEWIDYNGHMNLAYYVLAFDYATDVFLDYLGLTEKFRRTHDSSTFAAEIHVSYARELHVGDAFRISTQLIDYDEKRIHYFHRMNHLAEGWMAAGNELMSLHMDMSARKVAPMHPDIQANLAELWSGHAALPTPSEAGRAMGIPGGRCLR